MAEQEKNLKESLDKLDTLKRNLISSLEKSLGIITTACKAANIERSTYYHWYKTDENFKFCVDDVLNTSLDFAESKLFQAIQGYTVPEDKVFLNKDQKGVANIMTQRIDKQVIPDVTAIIFYLKTKGKHRGYVERQEISMDKDITVVYDDRLKAVADASEAEE